MSRFLSNDFINKDPRAKLTVAKMANIGDLVTPSAEYLTASGLTSLTVTAGCVVTVGSTGVFKTDATVLSTGNLDAGSAFVVGKDERSGTRRKGTVSQRNDSCLCDPFSVGDRMRRYESCCGTFGRKKSDGADCGL